MEETSWPEEPWKIFRRGQNSGGVNVEVQEGNASSFSENRQFKESLLVVGGAYAGIGKSFSSWWEELPL